MSDDSSASKIVHRNGLDAGKRVLAIWVEPRLQNDGIFDVAHRDNRDDNFYSFRALRKIGWEHGWEVHTQDVIQRAGIIPDAVLFLEVPRRPAMSLIGPWAGKVRLYTYVIESPLIAPHIWDMKRHQEFAGVFTWDTRLIGRGRYVGVTFCGRIEPDIILERDLSRKKKLCVMIAANKRPRIASPQDLYVKRLDCIRWFEANRPNDFDLYGFGWNDATIRYAGRLRRLGLMGIVNKIVGVEARPSYRGSVDVKLPTLARYRFNIVFENARDIPGFVTEKIFDTFLAGTVPVYWGAPNIADFVNNDCFIDFRNFKSFEELDSKLRSMSDEEYGDYINSIEAYMRGPRVQKFRAETVADTIIRTISR